MSILPIIASYLYTLICVFIPCTIYQIIQYKRWDHTAHVSKPNLAWRIVFLLYLCVVMRLVGMGSIWDIGHYGPIIRPDEIKLIPFEGADLRSSLLNILLFMPLGFLLPLLWRSYQKLSKTALAGFLFSIAIEVGQLFNHRFTDIDDVIMNTLGTVVGFALWALLNKAFHLKPKDENIFPDAPGTYLALTIAGTFLLYSWRLFRMFR